MASTPSIRVRQWRDIDMMLGASPRNGDLAGKSDIDSIKQQMRYLLQFERYDDPFHPEVYVGIEGINFDNFTPHTQAILQRLIQNAIITYVTRVTLTGEPKLSFNDRNELSVSISFTVKGIPEPQTFQTILRRLR